MQNIPEIVKNVVIEELKKHNINIEEIYLFGSRAKGNYSEDSDWDFYIIVDKDLDFSFKRKINANLRRKLAELSIPIDIIIQSRSLVEQRKNNVGYLTYYVLKEGINIL